MNDFHSNCHRLHKLLPLKHDCAYFRKLLQMKDPISQKGFVYRREKHQTKEYSLININFINHLPYRSTYSDKAHLDAQLR